MAVSIPRKVVERVLLGPVNDRRQLQDSPILGDVWIAFANAPDKPHDLLITPHRNQAAGSLAVTINDRIQRRRNQPSPDIAYLQDVVAARLYFDEVLRVIVPMTEWWWNPRNSTDLRKFYVEDSQSIALETAAEKINAAIDAILDAARDQEPAPGDQSPDMLPAFDRYIALAGLILWAGTQPAPKAKRGATAEESFLEALRVVTTMTISNLLFDLVDQIKAAPEVDAAAASKRPSRKKSTATKTEVSAREAPLVWQVALNREVTLAVSRSVPTVKADAARTLFKVDCSQITWAILDSGINGNHPAFKGADGTSRVRKCFDFSNYRSIVSLDNLRSRSKRKEHLAMLLNDNLVAPPTAEEAERSLTKLAEDAAEDRPIDWELVRGFVDIKPGTEPSASSHGTHVAGIIGASRASAESNGGIPKDEIADGMCPEIILYDFRVLGRNLKETEFAVIAALQFIRHLNERTAAIAIHGANLSLSIPHDVHNYACGRTKVCEECERLIESGVVVVAAAGNRGYHSFQTKEGDFESYAAFSVTDPGNADGVITVGATHRYSPHTYGVSFFSSRGPTGDGRLKPDLVAPGERIRAPYRDGSWGDLDGTSMAAPHVSGAAAMLMARYPELIRQPRRIKRILCESATDLGRERTFQGHGMLDVLRAFQSI